MVVVQKSTLLLVNLQTRYLRFIVHNRIPRTIPSILIVQTFIRLDRQRSLLSKSTSSLYSILRDDSILWLHDIRLLIHDILDKNIRILWILC